MVKIILLIFAGIVAGTVLFIAVSDVLLKKRIEGEIDDFIKAAGQGFEKPLSNTDISGYPEPLQRYFRFAIKDTMKSMSFARLKHGGRFKADEKQNWVPIRGTEYLLSSRPGFIWFARVTMAPFVWICARDRYFREEGNMLVRLMSAFTIADERGNELSEAGIMRYLAECAWLPSALLNDTYIRWSPADGNSVDAIITEGARSAAVRFFINDAGEITKIKSERFRTVDGGQVKSPWSGYYSDYREAGGFMVPFRVEVEWNLPGRDYKYADFTVTDIDFNVLEKW